MIFGSQDSDPLGHSLGAVAGAAAADSGGVVSVWYGPPAGAPAYARGPDHEHLAASTIKTALLVALHRLADVGAVDLDAELEVRNEFASVLGGTFAMPSDYDNDEAPWERLGRLASMRWLARHMIVRSSNLATDLLLEYVGIDAVAVALQEIGVHGLAFRKPICDDAADAAGIANTASAGGLAALLGTLCTGTAASAGACAEMLEVLRDQEYVDGIPAGLPAGTRVASKGGWIDEARHDTAIVEPAGADPYLLVVCTSGVADADALALIRRIASTTWADRVGR